MSKINTSKIGSFGIVTLDRQEKLNVLDEELIEDLKVALEHFRDCDEITDVVINANGSKGFCAGGDVVSVVRGIDEGREVDFFFRKEYFVDQLIHDFPKPVTTLAHGITFGGGFGLFSGGRTKVCFEDTLFSMPEVTIGFFPDVASSYFLQNVPRSWRLLMGMCGARISSYWALFLGLTDFVLPLDLKNDVLVKLCDESFCLSDIKSKAPAEVVDEFEFISDKIAVIDEIRSCEDFDLWVRDELVTSDSAFLNSCGKSYINGSRLSSFVTWRLFHWCEGKSLERCFEMDLRLSKLFGTHVDFKEGVRALLIDKDKNPQFRYQSYSEIHSDDEEIKNFLNCF